MSPVDTLGCSIDTLEPVSEIRRLATPISTEILGAPSCNRTETENRLTALSGPLRWKDLSAFSPPVRFPNDLLFHYLPSLLRMGVCRGNVSALSVLSCSSFPASRMVFLSFFVA